LSLKIPPLQTYLICVVGNIIPVLPILIFLEKVSSFLRRYKRFDTFFTWLFERSYRKSGIVQRWGKVGLMFFVAIPLPVTGAWTGSVVSYLLGIEKRAAFLFIFAGVCIAGFLVLCASLGIINLLRLFFGV
jgi:uncharacterized membrane protein